MSIFYYIYGAILAESSSNPFFSATQKVLEMIQISRTFLYINILN